MNLKKNFFTTDKPSPPKAPLDITDVTPQSLVLTWNAPEDLGGLPLSNYIVEKRDVRRSGWSVVNDTIKDTTLRVTLLQCADYEFDCIVSLYWVRE